VNVDISQFKQHAAERAVEFAESGMVMRLVIRQDESYAAKLLAAMRDGGMRNQFGGHAVMRKE
jgi:6-phosphogluconate dehydrogenase (decarboxylating)